MLTFVVAFVAQACTNVSERNYSGYWVEKKGESELIIINRNNGNYVVENNDRKYTAQVNDKGVLEISADLIQLATIDESGQLIIGGSEYIPISESKTYSIRKFQDCSLGDNLHLTFHSLNLDFGAQHGNNNYGDIQLCVDDKNGFTAPNPLYKNKEFIIKWDQKKVKVTDPTDPWVTTEVYQPVITYLKLIE